MYVERLCRHAFIIRDNPEGTPWNTKVVGHIIPWWKFWKFPRNCVIAKAYEGVVDKEMMEAFIKASNSYIRLPVWWMRLGRGAPYWLYQTEGVYEGKVKMARKANSRNPLHAHVKDPSTVSDDAGHMAEAMKVVDLVKQGKVKFSDITEVHVDDKSDLIIAKRTWVG